MLTLAVPREETGVGQGPLAANARYFVRAALLAPDADHYTLLGCRPTDTASTIRDHYRLLMRLTHPDFSASSDTRWPSGAAARLNAAYGVLSSPQSREAYDAELQSGTLASSGPKPQPVKPAMERAQQRVHPQRLNLRHLAWGFGGLGAGAAALWWTATQSDPISLVERRSTPTQVAARPAQAAPPVLALTDSSPQKPASATTPVRPVRPAQVIEPNPSALPPPVALDLHRARAPLALQPNPAPILPAALVNPEPSTSAQPATPSVQAAAPLTVPLAPPAALPAEARAPSMNEVHPLLAKLMQELESGRGDRIEMLLEPESRAAQSTRGFISNFESLTSGAQQVRVVNAQFSGKPQGARLVVLGNLALEVAGTTSRANPHMVLEAQFARGPSGVAMTRLSASR